MPRRNSDDADDCCGAILGCICCLLVAAIIVAGGGYLILYVLVPYIDQLNSEMNSSINQFADEINEQYKHDLERMRIEFEARQRHH